MGPIAATLFEQFRFTHFAMVKVATDLKNEDALARCRGGKGASITWSIGHLCSYRYNIVKLLGGGETNPMARFQSDAATNGSDYPDIAEMFQAWNASHAATEAAFEGVEDAQLLAPMPGGGPHSERRVLDALVFFAWHEAYHMGAIGMMRVEMGYSATADRVTKE